MSVKPWAVKGLVPVQHSALKKAIASLQTLAEVSPQLFFQLQMTIKHFSLLEDHLKSSTTEALKWLEYFSVEGGLEVPILFLT